MIPTTKCAIAPDEALAALVPRIGALHLRQRLGLEQDHEQRSQRRIARLIHGSQWASLGGLLRLGLHLGALHGRARRNARRIAVRQHSVSLPHLPPAFDGFTLLQLSDLHIDAAPDFAAALIETVQPLTYDLCVLTGDYRSRTFGRVDDTVAGLAALRPHLRGTPHAVLGNHDTIRLVPPMEALGYRFLINECVAVERGGAAIFLAGIEDAHDYRLADFARATAPIPAGAASILLSHSPVAYRHAAHAGFDLMLSGHTHAGQVCLPGGVPVFTARTPRRVARGAWRHHAMVGYTAAGSGTSLIDVRLNCPPEVTLHVLRRGPPAL